MCSAHIAVMKPPNSAAPRVLSMVAWTLGIAGQVCTEVAVGRRRGYHKTRRSNDIAALELYTPPRRRTNSTGSYDGIQSLPGKNSFGSRRRWPSALSAHGRGLRIRGRHQRMGGVSVIPTVFITLLFNSKGSCERLGHRRHAQPCQCGGA